jgi:hypothetical protein
MPSIFPRICNYRNIVIIIMLIITFNLSIIKVKYESVSYNYKINVI